MNMKEITSIMDFVGIKYKCIKSISNDTDPKIIYEMTKGKQDQVIKYSTLMNKYNRKLHTRL